MVKACPDKAASEAMARKLESEAELRRRGLEDSTLVAVTAVTVIAPVPATAQDTTMVLRALGFHVPNPRAGGNARC